MGTMMAAPIAEEIVEKVINACVNGGTPMSYYVHFTAERVMLLFGISPKSHRDALRSLIEEQTSGQWRNDPELATKMGAKMAVGLPDCLNQLRRRLDEATNK